MGEMSAWVDRWMIEARNYMKTIKTLKHEFYRESAQKWEMYIV
jgi:hypothetical protein